MSLYCRLPFGKMHKGNPEVKALAEVMGRTPSAVSMKLGNYASLDPAMKGRGIKGMANSSSADREIWAEFYGRWEELSRLAAEGLEVAAAVEQGIEAPSGPSEVIREVAVRRGQAFFRAAVLAAHESTCCITGIKCEALLRASHIVPWAEDEKLRLDPHNGLCLNALHDAAFDRGLITLGERFELWVSRRVQDEVPRSVYREMFESREGVEVRVPERYRPRGEYLEWHRERVFVG